MSLNYFEGQQVTSEILNEIQFSGSEFIDCDFKKIDFSEISLDKSKFIECRFTQCNFSNVKIKFATFRDVVFDQCKAIGMNWTLSHTLFELKFKDSVLDYSIFNGLKLTSARFENCMIKNVDFSEADLAKSSFAASDLRESSFHNASLEKSNFVGAKNYRIDVSFTNIKKARFCFPEAFSLLEGLDIIIE